MKAVFFKIFLSFVALFAMSSCVKDHPYLAKEPDKIYYPSQYYQQQMPDYQPPYGYQYNNSPAGSRYYSNPYAMPPAGNYYYPRYDYDQYYVPQNYPNAEPEHRRELDMFDSEG